MLHPDFTTHRTAHSSQMQQQAGVARGELLVVAARSGGSSASVIAALRAAQLVLLRSRVSCCGLLYQPQWYIKFH